jgi:hypothetical protein
MVIASLRNSSSRPQFPFAVTIQVEHASNLQTFGALKLALSSVGVG